MHYYTQKTKTGCLLDVLCTATQKNRAKLKERHKLDFFLYNYLKYSCLVKTLHKEDIGTVFVNADTNKLDVRFPAIIGVNGHEDDYRRPLHAMFYDGGKVWEPWHKTFYNIEDLKIVYAFHLFPLRTVPSEYLEQSKKEVKKWDANIDRHDHKQKLGVGKEKFKYIKLYRGGKQS